MTCAHHTGPENEESWEGLMRFNIPIRVFASLYDSDPTDPDPHEPFYWQIAMEIKKLTPSEYSKPHAIVWYTVAMVWEARALASGSYKESNTQL